MKRVENWHTKLNSFVLDNVETEFEYGKHDCCMAVVKFLRELTGEDVIHVFGEYHSEEEAEALLKKFRGVGGLAKKVAQHYHVERVDPRRATAGDVSVTDLGDGRLALGFVALNGRDIYIPNSPIGWRTLPVSNSVRMYKIP